MGGVRSLLRCRAGHHSPWPLDFIKGAKPPETKQELGKGTEAAEDVDAFGQDSLLPGTLDLARTRSLRAQARGGQEVTAGTHTAPASFRESHLSSLLGTLLVLLRRRFHFPFYGWTLKATDCPGQAWQAQGKKPPRPELWLQQDPCKQQGQAPALPLSPW